MIKENRWLSRACLSTVGLMPIVIGCGSSFDSDAPPSRASALSAATTGACDWYEKCGLIGPGAVYPNRETCENQTRAQLDTRWPASSCEGKISSAGLEACVDAIATTACENALDAFNTLASKCPRSAVCNDE